MRRGIFFLVLTLAVAGAGVAAGAHAGTQGAAQAGTQAGTRGGSQGGTQASPPAAHSSTQPVPEVVPAACQVSDALVYSESPLPRLAGRLAAGRPVTVVVLGSGSTAGGSAAQADASYPMRLQGKLAALFPNASISVRVVARRGWTAGDMLHRIETEIVPLNPALVIWQTGTADANRGVSLNEFAGWLNKGISLLHAKGIDVLLMDMQFSPYTEAFVNLSPYRGYMRWAAHRNEVSLFRRHDIMEQWSQDNVFDLSTQDAAEQQRNATTIHDCLAGLLAKTIESGVRDARGDFRTAPSGDR